MCETFNCAEDVLKKKRIAEKHWPALFAAVRHLHVMGACKSHEVLCLPLSSSGGWAFTSNSFDIADCAVLYDMTTSRPLLCAVGSQLVLQDVPEPVLFVGLRVVHFGFGGFKRPRLLVTQNASQPVLHDISDFDLTKRIDKILPREQVEQARASCQIRSGIRSSPDPRVFTHTLCHG